MPGDAALLEEYLRTVDLRLRPLVRRIWEAMQLAGEAGSLLKIEAEIKEALEDARRQNLVEPAAVQMALHERGRPAQQAVLTISSGAEADFWRGAEDELVQALHDYAAQAENSHATRRRLFADAAARGFAFIDLARKRFDVTLMNPPFGEASRPSKAYIEKTYPRTKNDLYAAFVERGLERLERHGLLGAITSRTGFYLSSFQTWREEILLSEARPAVVADLGYGVMDAAMVEAAAYTLERVR